MSSTTSFQRCDYCVWSKQKTTKCGKCGHTLCDECLGKHNEKICELLTTHLRTLIDTCKVHNGVKVVSFCYICSQLLCDKCTHNHAVHKSYIFELRDAVKTLIKTSPELKEIYENRLSEIDMESKALSKAVGGSKVNNSFVKGKLQIYEKNALRKHPHMMKLKAVIENAIENLPQLDTCKTNPLIFIRLWIGITSEIKDLEEELGKMQDAENISQTEDNADETPRNKTCMKVGDVVTQTKHKAETTTANADNDHRRTQPSEPKEMEQRMTSNKDTKGLGKHAQFQDKLLDKNIADQPPKQTQQSLRERNVTEERTNPSRVTKMKENDDCPKNESPDQPIKVSVDQPPTPTQQAPKYRKKVEKSTNSSSVTKTKEDDMDPKDACLAQPVKDLADKPLKYTQQATIGRIDVQQRTTPSSITKTNEQDKGLENANPANPMKDSANQPPKHTHQSSERTEAQQRAFTSDTKMTDDTVLKNPNPATQNKDSADQPPTLTQQPPSVREENEQRSTSSSDTKTKEHDKVPENATLVNTMDDSADQPPKQTQQLSRERKEVQKRADKRGQHAANVLATGSHGSTGDTSPETVSDETQQLLNIQESMERTTPDSKVEEDKNAVRHKGTPDTTVNAKGDEHLKKILKTPSGHSDKGKCSSPRSETEGKDRVVHKNGKPPQAMYTQADCTHTNTEQSSRAQKKSEDTLTTDKPSIDTSAPDENISAEQNPLNEQNDDETWTMVPNINETGELDQNDDHREPPAATTNVSTDEHPENNQHLTMGLEENNESSNSGSKDKRRERSSDSHEGSKPNNIATSADDVSKVTQTPLSKCSKCIEMENSEQEKTKYLLEIEEFKKSYSKLLADYVQEQEKCDDLRLQGDAKFKTMERQRLEQRNESENIIKKLQSKIEDLESSELKQKKKMKMLEERVTFAEGCIKEKENKIQIIQSNLRQREQDFQHQQSNCKKLTDQLKESNRRLKEVREGMDKMSKINKERDIYFKDIEKMNQQVLVENEKTKAEFLEARKMQSRYFTAIQNKNCEAETLLQQYQIYQDEASKAIERENEVSRQLTLANNELIQRSKRLTDLEDAVKALKSERDDLQTRLSSFAGDKLTAGNPAITDLGDSKRPMKIGEMYGELYDNEWTDAMEITDTVKKHFHGKSSSEIEEIIIHHLHRILTTCYQGCFQTARKQVEDIAAILGMKLSGDKVNDTELNKLQGIMTHRSKIAGDFARKLVAEKAFCDSMLNDWDYPFKNEDVMNELISSTFYEKCLEICWYMVIQNPVMYLDDEIPPGTAMNKDIYREFTKSGDKVVYVVWPALFLHKDGPVLYKGVVQVK